MKRIITAVVASAVMATAATDDLTEFQGYLWGDSTFLGAPSRGVNVKEAWELGYRGRGVHVADVQMDWDLDHEDLSYKNFPKFSKTPPGLVIDGAKQHGTNSLGIIFAENDDKGMTGIASEADGSVWDMLHEVIGGKVGSTIDSAAAELRAGDILQLELSTSIDQNHGVGPAELNPSNWNAIKRAVDKGIIVIQAAGNGGENLDGPDYATYRSWGDNGSIIVGAGSQSQERLSISSYGERVNVQAWGDTVVASPGTYEWQGVTSVEWHHGVTFGNDNSRAYSFQFSGTSSALPMVTGAAAILQSWAIDSLERRLNSREMRDLLVQSGYAQDKSRVSGNIGPIPDVSRGLEILRGELPTAVNPTAKMNKNSIKVIGSTVTADLSSELLVSDLRGRVIAEKQLVKGELFNLNSLSLGSGIYLLKMQSGSTVINGRYMQK